MRDETLVVRAGHPPAAQGNAFLPGPVFAGPYHAAGEPAESPYTYGRFHNPTWTGYEAALAEMGAMRRRASAARTPRPSDERDGGGDSIGEGFIRMSAGCEHIDDLLADLAQALGG